MKTPTRTSRSFCDQGPTARRLTGSPGRSSLKTRLRAAAGRISTVFVDLVLDLLMYLFGVLDEFQTAQPSVRRCERESQQDLQGKEVG